MRLCILAIAITAGAAFAQDEPASTTAAPTIADVKQLPSQLSQLANLLPTLPPNWELPSSVQSLKDSLPTPPPGILNDLVNGIPTTVLRGLVNPASRSALQESVANGDSPQWYQDLPTPVKSYFALFASQIEDRSLTYNPTAAVATNASAVQANTDDGDGDGEAVGDSWDLGEAEDDESGALSAFDEKAISTSLIAAMGILGLAVAL